MTVKNNLIASIGFIGAMLLSACGDQAPKEDSGLDIINGSTPSDGGLIESSTVALTSSNGFPFCSGTLIDDRYVVSAAHCLDGFRGSLYIAFGRNSSEFQYIQASDFAIHPSYTGSFFREVPADIAIVELSQSAPQGYEPVPIYRGSLSGQQLILAGYGQTPSNGSGSLFYTTVQIASSSADEINVTANNTGACRGDSGGPAYVFDGTSLQVVGATSRGRADCRQGGTYTSTYSSVPYFESWLESFAGVNF